MNDPFLTEKDVVSIVKYSLLSLVFGLCLGAFAMVYFEKPKSHPVVASPAAVTVDRLADIERRTAYGEVSPGVAVSLRERITQFTAARAALLTR